MNNIRKAHEKDISRIAEIIVVNYRINFYPFFRNDEFYFGELNVLDTAKEFSENMLENTFVYDDGIIKGIVCTDGREIKKLFVEPQFQNCGIGAELLNFAVDNLNTDFLYVLEYNKRAVKFYQKHGFELTGEKFIEDDIVPMLKMSLKNIQLKEIPQNSPEKSVLEKINQEAFPQNERISIDDLYSSNKDGNLSIIGIYADNILSGFFVTRKFKNIAYIAYFAVSAEKRSKGIGSRALKLIRNYYENYRFIVEFESPDEKCTNNNIRLHRRNFYLRNGFFETGLYNRYRDVEFIVACSENDFTTEEYMEFIAHLRSTVPEYRPEIYRK